MHPTNAKGSIRGKLCAGGEGVYGNSVLSTLFFFTHKTAQKKYFLKKYILYNIKKWPPEWWHVTRDFGKLSLPPSLSSPHSHTCRSSSLTFLLLPEGQALSAPGGLPLPVASAWVLLFIFYFLFFFTYCFLRQVLPDHLS